MKPKIKYIRIGTTKQLSTKNGFAGYRVDVDDGDEKVVRFEGPDGCLWDVRLADDGLSLVVRGVIGQVNDKGDVHGPNVAIVPHVSNVVEIQAVEFKSQ